jgi:hypothetical protein
MPALLEWPLYNLCKDVDPLIVGGSLFYDVDDPVLLRRVDPLVEGTKLYSLFLSVSPYF